ncbi:MAG: hypothetical protein AAF830_01705 [Pseudomonadota bacterium]
MKHSTSVAIAFLLGIAGTIAVIIVGDYLGIIDLIDTSEPPLPLFIAILMCLTMVIVLRKKAKSDGE